MTSKLDTAGLVERLRAHADNQIEDDIGYIQTADDLMREAADLIEVLTRARFDDDHSLGAVALAEALAPFLASQLSALQGRVEAAEEAEDEAKDCFWAIYPAYVKLTGKGVSTEAARTALAARAEAAEARVAELEAALKIFAEEGRELPEGIGAIPDDADYALTDFPDLGRSEFTVGDLRRARAALAHKGEGR